MSRLVALGRTFLGAAALLGTGVALPAVPKATPFEPKAFIEHTCCVAKFVDKLKSTPDGEGSLLDHMLLLYGSPMANSNAHDHYPLPVVVFGHGAGRYQGNNHILAAPHTPMANLFMSIAAKEDIKLDSFGDSTGLLEI